MSSTRIRARSDGTCYTQVLFRHDGKQTSYTFEDHAAALRWKRDLDQLGPARALELLRIADDIKASPVLTLAAAGEQYIEQLTGVVDGTRTRYRRFMANDIVPFFGDRLPAAAVTDVLVRKWVNDLGRDRPRTATTRGRKANSAKTIANKHGFLFGLLESLRKAGTIPTNACEDTKLPPVHQSEMCFLEPDEFAALHAALPPRWRLLVSFLVATGARWGEATALKVGDVDRRQHTIRIRRAWKYTGGERQLGDPKTKKSRRTLNVDADLIGELPCRGREYGDWLFTNDHGRPVHVTTFYKQVWVPTLDRLAAADGDPLNGKRPRIHDLRHTCASWMLDAGIPITDVQEHLGHESIKTTRDRYGHVSRDAGARAAAAISARLPKPGPRPLVIAA